MPRGSRERGGSMVEFAVVAPLFFFVVFASIESGLMFRTHLVLEDMSRSAARVASIQRDQPLSDIAILTAISDRDNTLPGGVAKVIIFNTAALDGQLPPVCIDATNAQQSSSGVCSAYGPDYELVLTDATLIQPGYVASQRAEWDNIGIYVEYEYNYVTGFLGDLTLSSTSVQVIELSP